MEYHPRRQAQREGGGLPTRAEQPAGAKPSWGTRSGPVRDVRRRRTGRGKYGNAVPDMPPDAHDMDPDHAWAYAPGPARKARAGPEASRAGAATPGT
ncbi:hypothetical protein GCM10010381_64210 [Streptomyces xantholiticus]|nr:hypothetical protein GCM10010381_64210 [Streptomyces xantholiticus]